MENTNDDNQVAREAFLAMTLVGVFACVIITCIAVGVGITYPVDNPQDHQYRWSSIAEDSRPHLNNASLRYIASWNGVKAGSLDVDIDSKHNPNNLVLVRYKAHTADRLNWAFSWKTEGASWLRMNDLAPQYSYRFTRENEDRETSWTWYDRAFRRVSHLTMESDDKTPDWDELNFIHGLDLTSIFCKLGTLDLAETPQYTLDLVEDGTAYAVYVVPNRAKRVEVKAGTFDTHEMKITIIPLIAESDKDPAELPFPTTFHVWISQTRNIPVKMKYKGSVGSITIELASIDA